MPVYRIHHGTNYRHDVPAASAWQTVHLRPRDEPGQDCLEFDLDITPRALDLSARRDAFGNTLHVFTVRESHRDFAVNATSLVRRNAPIRPTVADTPTLRAACDATDADILGGEFTLEQFRHPSPLVPALEGVEALTEDIDLDASALLAMTQLGDLFHDAFTFDPTATDISTPLSEVLQHRRGVCQDFAHLYIAAMRKLGLAAGYVSGYLLTMPPEGQERLIGADAMHAWVSVHLPGSGWIDYDPTNHCFAGGSHIIVARGRDYADVSPVRGLFNGGGRHRLSLGVTVEPAEEPGLV
jgi:transglutaminase-like putative cysteine protease